MISLFKADKELYIISNGLKTWRFVNGSRSVIHESFVYEPVVRKRSEYSDEYGDSKSLSTILNFDSTHQSVEEITSLLYADVNISSFSIIILRVFAKHNRVVTLFKGFGCDFEIKLEDMSLSLSWATAARNFSNPIYTTKYQRLCNSKIYDDVCGLKFNEWAKPCKILNVSGRNISYEFILPDPIDDPENPGELIYPDPIDYTLYHLGLMKFQGFYKNIKAITADIITLDAPAPYLSTNDTIYIAPSCDYTALGKCSTLFNNGDRAIVFPNVPSVNPVNNQFMK